MIRFLSLILLMTLSIVASAQAPSNYTNINGRYRWIAGMFDSTFHIPKGATPSLRTGGSTNSGGLFYNTTDSSVYTYTGTQWIKLRGVVIDTTSLSNRINLKLNISDTATMLGNYINNVGYGLIKAGQVVSADSATLATYFLRRKDSLTSTNPLGYVTKKILADTASAIRGAIPALTGYVPYTGATDTLDMGQFGVKTKFLQFDTSSRAISDRTMQWSNDNGTIQFGMTNGGTITQNIGLQQFARVKNVQGSQINKGQVVYLYGASGDRASVKLADNRNDSTSSKTLGIAVENIPINDVGLVGTFGTMSGFNLSSYTDGDVLYLDSIPGGLTKTKPQAPYHLVFVGVVERNNAGNGLLFTNPQNGYELDELHDVRITKPVRNSAVLVYDSTNRLWVDTLVSQAGIAVTNIATNAATGITGGPITTSGTIAADTVILSTRLWRQKGIDSVQGNLTAGLALKVNISDTASMLLPYLRKVDTASLSNRINLKVNISDTASMLSPYLRKADTTSLSNRINLKLNISDTSTMLGNYVNSAGYGITKAGQVVSADSATLSAYYLRRKDSLTSTNLLGYVSRTVLADTAAAIRSAFGTGSVTSIATNNATGITGGPITSSGTLAIDTLLISTRLWRQKGLDSVQGNLTFGLATKVNISDTASMLSPYLRKADTTSLSNRINLKVNISDTSTMLSPYFRTAGVGLKSTSQTVFADTLLLSTRAWRQKGIDSVAALISTAVSGTTNYLAKFTGSTTVGNSRFFDNGTVTFLGNGDVNASPSTAIISGTGGSGTNIAGAEFRIRGGASTGNAAGGPITFYTSAAGTSGTGVNAATEIARFTSTGRLGLGLTNPYYRLESGVSTSGGISTPIRATNSSTASLSTGQGVQIAFANDIGFDATASSSAIRSTTTNTANGASDLSFLNWNGSALTERMRITSGGSVGIGTTTIGSTLQVNGGTAIGYSASTAAPTNGLSISGNTTIGTTSASGKFTIDPDDNQVGLAITGTSLTSANAQSLIDLAQTWNTTGNPTAIKLNITNTASGSTSKLIDLQVGGTSRFIVDKAGYTGINTGSPNSFLHVAGSMRLPHVTKSANYTLDATDYTVGFDCAASSYTATLPDATTCSGRIYVIYQYNTGSATRGVTLDGNGSQTINGLTTLPLTSFCDYTSVMIQSDGSNWIIISEALQGGCN